MRQAYDYWQDQPGFPNPWSFEVANLLFQAFCALFGPKESGDEAVTSGDMLGGLEFAALRPESGKLSKVSESFTLSTATGSGNAAGRLTVRQLDDFLAPSRVRTLDYPFSTAQTLSDQTTSDLLKPLFRGVLQGEDPEEAILG